MDTFFSFCWLPGRLLFISRGVFGVAHGAHGVRADRLVCRLLFFRRHGKLQNLSTNRLNIRDGRYKKVYSVFLYLCADWTADYLPLNLRVGKIELGQCV